MVEVISLFKQLTADFIAFFVKVIKYSCGKNQSQSFLFLFSNN